MSTDNLLNNGRSFLRPSLFGCYVALTQEERLMHYDEQREKEQLKPWLMQGDCLERMKEIADCGIDLTVTSPPYDNLRSYNGNNEQWGEHVYQATNFIYCGLSAKRTDWRVKGREHLHGQTIADEFRGVKNRAQAMRNKYGDDFYLAQRPRKHRYVFIVGSKKYKKKIKAALRYGIAPYPKAA